MIQRDDDDGIAVLRLAHGKASALDTELLAALAAELDAVEKSGTLDGIVLTGTGAIFSAGVDLFRVLEGGPAYLDAFLPTLDRSLRRLFTFPRPVVAALNGHAVAGGCVLAFACDYRLMVEGNSTIGVPELPVGVPFPAIALEILRFGAPADRLQEIVYLGKTYAVRDALKRGLIDETATPDALVPRATEVVRQLAAIPKATFALTKRQLRQPVLERIDRQARAADAEVARAWASPEINTAIRSYVQRRIKGRDRG